MDPNSSSNSLASSRRSQPPIQPAIRSSSTPRSKRSSAYDANFEQHYIDNDVYPPDHNYGNLSPYPEPSNLSEVKAAIAESRRSLSPSQLTPAQFRSFRMKNKSSSEGTVMRSVVPLLTGDKDICNEGHLPFTNFASMTNEATVKPVPDFWDGALPGELHKTIRNHEDLNPKVVPTKHSNAPIVPNFFLEVKAPSGGIDVAQRQAMAHGASGLRAIHSVQNFGLDEPIYDGKTYAYSSTYHAGNLRLYGHHLSAPSAVGEEPRYHMTQLRGYDITDSSDVYREGTAALRNLRDLAKRQRDQAITQANARALQPGQLYGEASGESQSSSAVASRRSSAVAPQSTDCSNFAYLEPQAHPPDENLASTSFVSAHEEDASYTTSFTSTADPNLPEARSKRTTSRGPPEPSRRKKASGKGKETLPPASSEYWTWSSSAQNWYHTKEDGSCEWYKAPRKGRRR